MRGHYDSSEENKDKNDRTMENIDTMAQRNGNGRYAVGSRWHETNLINMMTHFKNPTLAWRFGDG